MSADKVLELERERDAWKNLAREEGRAKLDYLYDAAMLQTKVDELQAELAQPCDCGSLTSQLAEAHQRAERAEKESKGFQHLAAQEGADRHSAELELKAALSAGVLPEGAVCFVPTGEYRPPKIGEFYSFHSGAGNMGIACAGDNYGPGGYSIMVPWHPPKAESGEGDEYAQDPDAGTLASELCRIADSIGRNDCTRSWAEKFIYSIVDELPPAIASHVMRPPITEPAPKAPAASEAIEAAVEAAIAEMQEFFGGSSLLDYGIFDGAVPDMKRIIIRHLAVLPAAPPAAEVGGAPFQYKGKTWRYTGEIRLPREGEHYFHDASNDVWLAHEDFSNNEYRIVVEVPPVTAKGTQYAADITDEMQAIVGENKSKGTGEQSNG